MCKLVSNYFSQTPTLELKLLQRLHFVLAITLSITKSPFTDDQFLKEAMTVTADTLLKKNFKNKLEGIKMAIKSILLGPATVMKRVDIFIRNPFSHMKIK